jgi:hypothetical protein
MVRDDGYCPQKFLGPFSLALEKYVRERYKKVQAGKYSSGLYIRDHK